jgi:hypothetical protein
MLVSSDLEFPFLFRPSRDYDTILCIESGGSDGDG